MHYNLELPTILQKQMNIIKQGIPKQSSSKPHTVKTRQGIQSTDESDA